ncbi:MAG TPA: KUP/HAK/KT family potassium transporter [Mycobacteriales bacterium]|nr:KUP/HAK/KT family potassium transporter [Mycobacteriales bacterium]
MRHPGRAAATLGALGIVFGDIGTSPIYTIQTIFSPDDPHPVPLTTDNVYGLVSLVFWSVTVIVTVLYVGLVLRADNDGEGGILSLITLVARPGRRPGRRSRARTLTVLTALGVLGASLFLADSMITPAISVLSAVEGLKVVRPGFEPLVIPVTIVIILALFAAQRIGTARVGRVFGPVMTLWFLAIGAAGIAGITAEPGILKALSPTYALGFFVGHFGIAFFALAAVVLAVTGAEALYADLGHFGRAPISRAWLALVFPACTLSYFGQGALVLHDPGPDGAIRAPFFLLVPSWALIPLVLLATAATVIASQAVITGAFSVARQAVQLGYLPRLRILHTSMQTIGQIYVPAVNWALMVMVIVLVLSFQTSAALAFAFGMAVTGTITVTTTLLFYVARQQWGWPTWAVLLAGGGFLLIELMFLAANLTKLISGAWLPLLIGLTIFTVMTTWQQGRRLVSERREQREGPLRTFVDELHERRPAVHRVPGTAVFLNRDRDTAPLAMRASVERIAVLQQRVLIVSIQTAPVPLVAPQDVATVDDLGYRDDGITLVTARFGFMQRTDIPGMLAALPAEAFESPVDLADASYFLSTIRLEPSRHPTMPRWRTQLFLALSSLTADAARAFELPADRTVVISSHISV